MKMNKLRREEVDYLINLDVESHWSNSAVCVPNLALMEFKFIADEIVKNNANVKYSDIFISYHYNAAEYCIYIKDKWSGYVEEWYVEGYKSHEDYYGLDNKIFYPILRLINNFVYKEEKCIGW